MVGRSFHVVLESGATVGLLKAEIEEVEGTPGTRQDLLMLCDGSKEGSDEPLLDSFVIPKSCTVALCVKADIGNDRNLLQSPSCFCNNRFSCHRMGQSLCINYSENTSNCYEFLNPLLVAGQHLQTDGRS